MKIVRLAITLALCLCFIGCGVPAVGQISHTQNPLVAQYLVSPPMGSAAAVEFGPDANYGFMTSSVSATAAAPTVPILVAGMKQNSTYHMRAVTMHPDGTKDFDRDQVFTTGAAPAGRMPGITVTVPSGSVPSPGVELVGLNPPTKNLGNPLTVVALNPAGDLIWYYDFDSDLGIAQPIKLLPNGHFLMVLFGGTTGPGGTVREIDLTGQTIHEFTVDDLNRCLSAAGFNLTANAIHHDILPLPNGHLLVLANANRKFTLPGHRWRTKVLGDVVIDLDTNYKPVWVWSSFDHLDVNRHPMGLPDWTHTNEISYSPDDGNLVLSMRHQSWLVKIDYANGHGTGNIVWRLGYQGDFTLLNSRSPADWFFAQHFASFIGSATTRDFQLALFDNGNSRVPDSSATICGATAPDTYIRPAILRVRDATCYSRPVVFDVNEAARTAKLLWSYVVPYSYWGGVNMELPNTDMYFDITRRSDLIDRPVNSVEHTLIEGLVLVSLVIVIFFWQVPSAAIPMLAIPIALILTFVPILGAIAVAIGVIIDGAVVMAGQTQKKPEHQDAESRSGLYRRALISAVKGVSRPSFFALVVIAVSFLPPFNPPDTQPGARVMEVTRQEPPQIIWELNVNGQESYRTIHLPSLYPGVQW